MRQILLLGAGAIALQCAFGSIPIPGDANKGAQVFKDQKCVVCHSVNGEGGKSAPDLGRRTGRAYTPDTMVSVMWNHAATMWQAFEKQGIRKPQLTDEQAADLFAYFSAVRYLERPGDAGRGKALFASKHCADCHLLSGSGAPGMGWQDLGDPIALAQSMWNHSREMGAAVTKKNLPRPTLTSQEFADILVFLQSQPQAKGAKAQFAPASAETGKELFRLKGCFHCHNGATSLEDKIHDRSMTDLAASMWNHGRKGDPPPPEMRPEEMRRIVGYLWSIQYFEPKGDAKRGKAVFEKKLCASCHDQPESGAPSLASKAGAVNSFSMVASLWAHGSGMLSRMKTKNIGWQQFTSGEMSDLIAFLNNPK